MSNTKSTDFERPVNSPEQELKELREWKAQHMQVWSEVYDAVESKMTPGQSISKYILRALRERDLLFEIYESIKRAR